MIVLIESDWNLKNKIKVKLIVEVEAVLIESDWNLKILESCRFLGGKIVLIESDWNLKFTA